VIAAMETGSLARNLGNKGWTFVRGRLPLYLGFVASCGLLYFAVIRETQSNSVLQEFWAYAFMPFPPHSLKDLGWFIGNFYEMFRHPIGLPEPGVAPFLFLVGCVTFWRRRLGQFLGVPGVLVWVLIASALKQYPFGERLLLFATVPLALTIGLGFSSVVSLVDVGNPGGRVLMIFLAGLLLVPVLLTAASRLARPRTVQDFRSTFGYINERWRANDEVVAQSGYDWQIEWYRDRRGGMPILGSKAITVVSSAWKNCGDVRHMLAERGSPGRTWILLYNSEWSKLFSWCVADLGVTHVRSTPDDELFIYPGHE
jgi:hypothetical protein